MADTVDVQALENTLQWLTVRLQNRSDGTGEAGVIKVDKSTYVGPKAGVEPGSLVLCEARWAVQGFASVRLDWDHTTDDELATFSGNGFDDFGGLGAGVKDPKTTGGTGDVLLTTSGGAAGSTYDITLKFRKKA